MSLKYVDVVLAKRNNSHYWMTSSKYAANLDICQMNIGQLKELVSDGETERVEFKRSTGQRTDAARAVCGMLNGLGGFVLFGVNDKGEIIGQQVTSKTLEDIVTEIRRIEPPAFPDIETIVLDKGLSVIVVTVPGSSGGLYAFDGRAYLRQGPTTSMMPRDEYERRLVERIHATPRWENEPVADGVSVEDLDADEIQLTLDTSAVPKFSPGQLWEPDPRSRRFRCV